MVAKTEFTLHFIHRTVHQHGYEDVTLHMINVHEQTILQNSPIFIHTSNHILPGRRRGRHRPPAVGWSICQRRCFSRLTVRHVPAIGPSCPPTVILLT